MCSGNGGNGLGHTQADFGKKQIELIWATQLRISEVFFQEKYKLLNYSEQPRQGTRNCRLLCGVCILCAGGKNDPQTQGFISTREKHLEHKWWGSCSSHSSSLSSSPLWLGRAHERHFSAWRFVGSLTTQRLIVAISFPSRESSRQTRWGHSGPWIRRRPKANILPVVFKRGADGAPTTRMVNADVRR